MYHERCILTAARGVARRPKVRRVAQPLRGGAADNPHPMPPIIQDGSRSASPLGEWLFAAVFWCVGLAIIALAVGLIPSSPDKFLAPRWVLAAAGALFVAGGFAPLASRLGADSFASQILAAVVCGCLALVFNWIAFGPGPRHFSGATTIAMVTTSGAPPSEFSGRAMFGVVAVLLDLALVRILVKIGGRWGNMKG
jgi:hypothetical protein